MSYYDDIYEYAADNYGLITSSGAYDISIPNVELVKLAHRGRLSRLGYGVYRVAHYIPTPLDKYAEAVSLVGRNAYVFGESVLAMHGLALVNPPVINIGVTNRVRKQLPAYIRCIFRKEDADQIVHYEGIPAQSVFDAILTCKTTLMKERLEDAIIEAKKQGLISERELGLARRGIL
jgi:predicted transcriptional regulator of viral defense system